MRAWLFPPGGLDPVLDGGVGDKDAVVAPQVPTGGPIRQAVLDDQADGRLLHAPGVVTLGEGQIGHAGVEAPSAVGAAVLGVGDDDIERPAGADITQVVEGPPALVAARGGPAAPRARTTAVVAAAVFDMRGRQVLDSGDPFGGVRDVIAWPIHNSSSRRTLSRKDGLHATKRKLYYFVATVSKVLRLRQGDPGLEGWSARPGGGGRTPPQQPPDL